MESLHTTDGNAKWCNHYEKPSKITDRTTIYPVIPLLGIYRKELKSGSQRDIFTPMLIAALLTIAKIWTQLKSSWTDEWIEKMWDIYIKWNVIQP